VPAVDGPLNINVVYPAAGAAIDAGDSTFAFGTVGSGRATLTLNGAPVRVWPNGSWLAWVRLAPEPESRFDLVARRGRDSVRATLPVRRTARFRTPARGLWVDTTSFVPSGRVWWPADEPLPISVRATENATVRLRLPDGRSIPLGATSAQSGVSDAIRAFDRDSVNLRTAERRDVYTAALLGTTLGAPLGAITNGAASRGSAEATLEVTRNGDTLRVRWPLQLTPLTAPWPWVELDDDRDRRGNTDRISYGRARPYATYHWFFHRHPIPRPRRGSATTSGSVFPGVPMPGSRSTMCGPSRRRRLGLPPSGASRRHRAGIASIRIPVGWRVPFQVEERDDGVTLTLHSAVGDVN
jgi:hypothetical protein